MYVLRPWSALAGASGHTALGLCGLPFPAGVRACSSCASVWERAKHCKFLANWHTSRRACSAAASSLSKPA